MKIIETGFYIIKSSSNINLYGFIYNKSFIPSDPVVNLFAENDDGSLYEQFLLRKDFYVNATYILVVTTRHSQITGHFSVIAFGPNKIIFSYFGKYSH